MWRQCKNAKFYIMIIADSVLFTAALTISFLLRMDFNLQSIHITQINSLLPMMIGTKVAIFFALGLYRGMWRYTSLRDIIRLGYAAILACAVVVTWLVFHNRFNDYSRAVMLMDTMLTFLLTAGVRVGIRLSLTSRSPMKEGTEWWWPRRKSGGRHRVLIVGAGNAGEKLFREIEDAPHLGYQITAFIDDAPGKAGRTLHGIRIYGPLDILPNVVKERNIHDILIAIPSATGPQMRRIVELCEAADVSFKTLPGMSAIIDGRVTIQSIRKVDYEDLLGRAPVMLDTAGIRELLHKKKALITGCGGSIGSELCRQIVKFQPEQLILWDASEANLYQLQMELHHELEFHDYIPILGQIQQSGLLDRVFAQYKPDIVFHAAAYKHVPLLEQNPWDAVLNNIVASEMLMKTAVRHQTHRFVLVSTDKAVRPTNVMGASKRATEIILQSLTGRSTRFMAVRFGNVLGSAGSVIPLFQRQIEHGGPVTVTDREVTRYFMTIPEAAQLILQAGSMGNGGELFILDMGTPVKIVDMARDLIRLSGKEPDIDIPIVFTGMRPGEKLYEELITEGEGILATHHRKIRVIEPSAESAAAATRALQHLGELTRAAGEHNAESIRKWLGTLVPEYTPEANFPVLNVR